MRVTRAPRRSPRAYAPCDRAARAYDADDQGQDFQPRPSFLFSKRIETAPQAPAETWKLRPPETGQFRRLGRFGAGFDLCRLPRRWPDLPPANLPLQGGELIRRRLRH